MSDINVQTFSGKVKVSNDLTVTTNVHADYFKGDGSLLTNLPSGSGGVWNTNSDNEIYFISSNVGISNADPGHNLSVGSNLYVDDDGSNVLVVTGNVKADYFVGDGSLLTGLSGSGGVWSTNGDGEIYFINSNVGISNADPGHNLSVGSNLYIDDDGSNVLVVTGNVKADYFSGDGSLLTNLPSGSGGVWSTNGDGEIYFINSNVGISNADPGHNLSVGSNLYVDDDGSNVLVIDGNLTAESMTLGGIGIVPSYPLSSVTDTGNTTPHTIEFTNATTGLVTTGNVEVGKELNVTGNVQIRGTTFIKANRGTGDIAIGTNAGLTSQGDSAVAMGRESGQTTQGFSSVAVGVNAGQTTQGGSAVAVGRQAGQTDQKGSTVAVGYLAGNDTQGFSSVAVGVNAGETTQGLSSVAVGRQAGQTSQGNNTVAIGIQAGQTTQGIYAVAMGRQAGNSSQGGSAVAVGREAGQTTQGLSSVAVGYLAGNSGQGDNAVAVGRGAGQASQGANSIILNATGDAFNSTTASSFHVKPVRGGNFTASALAYTADGEIVEETGTHFDASGNVGIGTTSPGNKFEVTDISRFAVDVSSADHVIVGNKYSSADSLSLVSYGSVNVCCDANGNSIGKVIDFRTNSSSNGGTLLMRIKDDGNVGIGTDSPGTINGVPSTSVDHHVVGRYIVSEPGDDEHWSISTNNDFDLKRSINGQGYIDAARIRFDTGAYVDLITFTGQHRSSHIENVTPRMASEYEGLIVCANRDNYESVNGDKKRGNHAITINEAVPLLSLSSSDMDKTCFGVISNSEDPDNRIQKFGNFLSHHFKMNGDEHIFINSIGEGGIWVVNVNGPLESGDYITTSNIRGYGMKQDDQFLANYTVAKITMNCNFNPQVLPIQRIVQQENVVTKYLDIKNNIVSTEEESHSSYETKELVNVLDEHGQAQWEDHPTETEKAYKIRHLDADGNITDEANHVYKAAFVGCTYHCG